MFGSALPNPPVTFYETAVTLIVTLGVALAIEYRLLRPHPDAKLPEDPKERRQTLEDTAFILTYIVAGFAALICSISALYQGGNKILGVVTVAGVAAVVVMFMMATLSIFLRLIGQAIKLPKRTRGIIMMAAGAAMVIAGVVIVVAG